MNSLKYNFSYFVIPDSIYHFTYENFNSIKIINDEVLLKNFDNKKISYNENLIKMERNINYSLNLTNENISFYKDNPQRNSIIENIHCKRNRTNKNIDSMINHNYMKFKKNKYNLKSIGSQSYINKPSTFSNNNDNGTNSMRTNRLGYCIYSKKNNYELSRKKISNIEFNDIRLNLTKKNINFILNNIYQKISNKTRNSLLTKNNHIYIKRINHLIKNFDKNNNISNINVNKRNLYLYKKNISSSNINKINYKLFSCENNVYTLTLKNKLKIKNNITNYLEKNNFTKHIKQNCAYILNKNFNRDFLINKNNLSNQSKNAKNINIDIHHKLYKEKKLDNILIYKNYLFKNKNVASQKISINNSLLLSSTFLFDKNVIVKKDILLHNYFENTENKTQLKKEKKYLLERQINKTLNVKGSKEKHNLKQSISSKIKLKSNILINKSNISKRTKIKIEDKKETTLIPTYRNIKKEESTLNLELYKTLWFIKGIGETDLKILPNTDYKYPALIDIFVEKPNYTYIFEYENTFKEFLNDNYTIELYDYDYNLISTLSIPQIKTLEESNSIINLKIEEMAIEENRFKFIINIIYPKLNYIIIRQPVNEYMAAVLYTVTEKFLGENRHPIPFGNDLGIREIPIHINIMIEFINILLLIWQHRFLAFSGQVGIHAIYGLVNLVYEWLTLDTSQNVEYIEEYYRCFRWLRWEAEKVYNVAKADPKLNGNKWINFLINEMIDYMEMHHIDVIPILEDIRNTDDWRNWFTDPTFDIKFMLDKFKGERKKLSDNNYRLTSSRTI